MSDTPRTDAEPTYKTGIAQTRTVNIDFARQLERELAEAQAEVVRLKGEAESWEKVFDRTCEHLADAKTNAERYRWLRDEAEWYSCHITNTVQFKTGANFLSLDAAIDAAMKEGK